MSKSNSCILAFIRRFYPVRDFFLYGFCYYFAKILYDRFSPIVPSCVIMYNMVQNHFAVLIEGCLYDASGVIPSEGFIPWNDVAAVDSLLYSRIVHDTIHMID